MIQFLDIRRTTECFVHVWTDGIAKPEPLTEEAHTGRLMQAQKLRDQHHNYCPITKVTEC